eukprot:jgi/Mesvir1/27782/Mv07464-RA.1
MSASFTEKALAEKLSKLTASQQSIETLSHWCIFHNKKFKHIVAVWEREYVAAAPDRKIAFIYLINDILQNSRKHGHKGFQDEVWTILPRVFKHVLKQAPQTLNELKRLLDIWEQRQVFPGHSINELRARVTGAAAGKRPGPDGAPGAALKGGGMLSKQANVLQKEMVQLEEIGVNAEDAYHASLQALEAKLMQEGAPPVSSLNAEQLLELEGHLEDASAGLADYLQMAGMEMSRTERLISMLQDVINLRQDALKKVQQQVADARRHAARVAAKQLEVSERKAADEGIATGGGGIKPNSNDNSSNVNNKSNPGGNNIIATGGASVSPIMTSGAGSSGRVGGGGSIGGIGAGGPSNAVSRGDGDSWQPAGREDPSGSHPAASTWEAPGGGAGGYGRGSSGPVGGGVAGARADRALSDPRLAMRAGFEGGGGANGGVDEPPGFASASFGASAWHTQGIGGATGGGGGYQGSVPGLAPQGGYGGGRGGGGSYGGVPAPPPPPPAHDGDFAVGDEFDDDVGMDDEYVV